MYPSGFCTSRVIGNTGSNNPFVPPQPLPSAKEDKRARFRDWLKPRGAVSSQKQRKRFRETVRNGDVAKSAFEAKGERSPGRRPLAHARWGVGGMGLPPVSGDYVLRPIL
jgi:hypothetical protein